MKFFALDVETANPDYSSICQIGIAEFRKGKLVDQWNTLVNPEDYFDQSNVVINGISENDVKGSPNFGSVYKELEGKINSQIVVHHMPFDRVAVNQACEKYNLGELQIRWLDSARIARRAWREKFARKGYGLKNVATSLGIEFQHHDALEDAITAGRIVSRACYENGVSIEEWFIRVEKRIFPSNINSPRSSLRLEGNPEGDLYGESVVFTGELSRTRTEMAEIAAELGCDVSNSVSRKTSILVLGSQNIERLSGHDKSSKHRRAEELIAKGVPIKILSEKDFVEFCNIQNAD